MRLRKIVEFIFSLPFISRNSRVEIRKREKKQEWRERGEKERAS